MAEFTIQNGSVRLRFVWTQEQSIAENTSVVKITDVWVTCLAGSLGGQTYQFRNNSTLTIDGHTAVTLDRNGQCYLIYGKEVWYNAYSESGAAWAYPWKATVAHNTDGTKSATIAVNFHGNVGGDIAGSTTIQLATIPRASTLTVNPGIIGASLPITINRASSSFSHTLRYRLGAASGIIAERTDSAILSWVPPMALCSQIPESESGSCTVTCETYSGNAKIGESSTEILLSVPPSVGLTVSPGWAAVGYAHSIPIAGFVQGYSKAKVTFDRSKIGYGNAYGASIAELSFRYGGKAYETVSEVLTTEGEQSLTAVLTDSRGRTVTEALPFTVLGYAAPVLTDAQCFRSDSGGNPAGSGTFWTAKANVSFSSLGGQNTVTLRARIRTAGGSYGSWVSMTPEAASVNAGLQVAATYEVELQAADTVGNTASNRFTIPTAAVGMNLRRGNNGAAFGKYAEHENTLELPENWNITVGGVNLFLLLHPVGSIYLSVDAADPGTLFGGTWSRIEDRFLLAAGGTYAPGATGGEAAHTLTVEEMPSHSHRPRGWAYQYSGGGSRICLDSGVSSYDNWTVKTTEVGGGQAHNNMPPYLAVYVWQRTA